MIADYPRIVRFLEIVDAPESQCPHCGADGRYIYRFLVADGRTLGAMRGCVKLFPASPVAHELLRLEQKRDRYVAQGWRLNVNDQRALEACEACIAGAQSEESALREVALAKRGNTARFRGRR